MARIRTLKPDMWQSESFGTVSIEAQALFVGLITQADDGGRIKGSAARMRALLWPYKTDLDTARIEQWLDELQSADLVLRYEAAGKQYMALPGWDEHQKIDHARESALPSPADPDSRPLAKSRELSRRLGLDQGSRSKDQGSRNGANAPGERQPSGATVVRELFSYWQEQCGHSQAQLTDDRRRKVHARLRECYSAEQIRRGIEGAAAEPYVNEAGKRYDDLELICRTGSKLEDFIERGERYAAEGSDEFVARMNRKAAA